MCTCTMLWDEYFSRVYHDKFLVWYAQREMRQPIIIRG